MEIDGLCKIERGRWERTWQKMEGRGSRGTEIETYQLVRYLERRLALVGLFRAEQVLVERRANHPTHYRPYTRAGVIIPPCSQISMSARGLLFRLNTPLSAYFLIPTGRLAQIPVPIQVHPRSSFFAHLHLPGSTPEVRFDLPLPSASRISATRTETCRRERSA